ncbi:MAG TPA: hypothetical protein VIJ75_01445 [Hanamia sp.]
MKQIKKLMLITLISLSLLCSCNGNGNSTVSKDSTSSLTSSAKNSSENSTGDASFSCKIDGKEFSGKGTDQIVNAAYVTSPGVIHFALSPSFSGDPSTDMHAGGFGFAVPDKGTTVIRGVENPDYYIGYNLPNEPTNTYHCKEMTVTINSSGTRVTGTFSGTLIEPKTDRDVPVTDGKFDIPYSSYFKK